MFEATKPAPETQVIAAANDGSEPIGEVLNLCGARTQRKICCKRAPIYVARFIQTGRSEI